ncbi:hypothetical protein GQ53DRAFT_53774 [Thozetella sp. PMI_491]|nr:hypothetical protein GQ53DRAFT_53774 [Thozetella sp. PMI_491]
MLSNMYALNLIKDDTDSIVSATILGNNNLLQFGYFLNSTDMRNITANIAETLSTQMQSASTGDNANLTLVGGVAQASETYVTVRWGILLPLLESFLTVVLLAVTILSHEEGILVQNVNHSTSGVWLGGLGFRGESACER